MSTERSATSTAGNWGLLRAGVQHVGVQLSGGLEIPAIPTEVSTAAGRVRLAVGQSGEARVLLPLAANETPATIQGGTGLSVSVSAFNRKGRPLRFLDLLCLSQDLEPVFAELTDEVLARVASGRSSEQAVRSTVEDFRLLLLQAEGGAIDTRRVAGLIAELLVLNRLLERSSDAWNAWRGPAGDRHGYRRGDTSLEMKASLRANASTITINGLEQLEVPHTGSLHLLRMVLEPVEGGALSVSGLASKALSRASEPGKLRTLLAAVGCRDIDAESWNRHRFRVDSESLYGIRPGFPRLTMSMLTDRIAPHGVHRVTYEIDLSAAVPFLCDDALLAELEESLCS